MAGVQPYRSDLTEPGRVIEPPFNSDGTVGPACVTEMATGAPCPGSGYFERAASNMFGSEGGTPDDKMLAIRALTEFKNKCSGIQGGNCPLVCDLAARAAVSGALRSR